tara:strand:+ start:51 stop:464 length:414 start_codon:yes stop_codon:yes gene_type:complete
MKKVLVLCTGNSCRSQMAEGFLRNLGVDVKSAGVESHGLNPYAVQVMREVNIDISTNISQKIHNLHISSFDILITVCDHAKDTCPNIPEIKTKIHKSFRDPAVFIASEKEKLLIYRDVRDQINVFCQQLICQDFNLI